MDYLVLESSNIREMQKQVNMYLKSGWKLQGGIACQGSHTLYQAMVK
jgi:sRNA-binding regulator protein Hfq